MLVYFVLKLCLTVIESAVGDMPFFDVDSSIDGMELTPAMPRPLRVSVMDKAQEREGRTTAALVSAFGYRDEAERLIIQVPKTFLTDFASIPGAARALFSPFGRHAKAAVLHDWLYAVGEPGLKATADRIFRNAMTELEVAPFARDVMYRAVDLFGDKAFDRAPADWPNTFADVLTGQTIPPLFERSAAFVGAAHGPQRF